MNAVVIFIETKMKRFQGVTTHKIKEYDMANLNHVRKFKREHVRKIKNKREHNMVQICHHVARLELKFG